ncbi:porin [Endozoicomonas sp. G2_1]|uniref:OmpP1/FadL family transporter n=1 Tax=Endozoicomonas sp. G2_1 TaxID=2821091 RepID=UPI001ADAEBF2|nr:outer membrane protein transport protein [Endozoicomonas sp. G2_1]MBO9491811.1 porin [Endozoicomonas sp. G2_1]
MYKKSLLSVAITSAVLACQSSALAAGFYLNEHSANGLGRAFAGQAAKPENASVLVANPAAITEFDQAQVSVFASYINSNLDIKGQTNVSAGPASFDFDASENDVIDSAVVPSAFYARPLNDKWSVGLSVFSNFGLATEFSEGYNALHFADKADITTIVFNPSLAYKVNDDLSLGFGISANYVEAELRTSVPANLAALSANTPNPVPANATLAAMEGDDVALGWNVGLYWHATDSTNIGVSYRAKTKFTVEGDISSALRANLNQSGSLDLDLPAIAEFAVDQALSQALSLQFSATWYEWSSFDELNIDLDDGNQLLLREENFENVWRVGLGTTYQLNDQWTVRGGYAYDEGAALTEFRSISIPDVDRQWFSLGATYQINKTFNVDLGYAYVRGKEGRVQEELALGAISSTFNGVQTSSANIYSVQLNAAF